MFRLSIGASVLVIWAASAGVEAQTAQSVIVNGLAEHGIHLTGRIGEWALASPVGSDQLGDFGWGIQYEHSYARECDASVVPAQETRPVAAQLGGSYRATFAVDSHGAVQLHQVAPWLPNASLHIGASGEVMVDYRFEEVATVRYERAPQTVLRDAPISHARGACLELLCQHPQRMITEVIVARPVVTIHGATRSDSDIQAEWSGVGSVGVEVHTTEAHDIQFIGSSSPVVLGYRSRLLRTLLGRLCDPPPPIVCESTYEPSPVTDGAGPAVATGEVT